MPIEMPIIQESPAWSVLYAARRAAAQRLGKTIYDLPLRFRVRDVLLAQIRDHHHVLEVGAGDRKLERTLAAARSGIVYESMDLDPHGDHDYDDLSEISRDYDCVLALEVAEHLPYEQLFPWLCRLASLVRSGGCLILSTPNTYYPPAFLRDATHKTPLCYDEFAGLVELAGLRVRQAVRIHHEPLHRRWLRRYAFGWLFRLLGLDFARQIMLVAERR